MLKGSGIVRSLRTIYRWLDEGHIFPRAKKLRDGWLIEEGDIVAVILDPSKLDEDRPITRPVHRRGVISRGIS